MKITKDTTIQEALSLGQEAFDVLSGYFGPGCMGCGAAAFETLEMACKAHGIDEKLVTKIVSQIQEVADKKSSEGDSGDKG